MKSESHIVGTSLDESAISAIADHARLKSIHILHRGVFQSAYGSSYTHGL